MGREVAGEGEEGSCTLTCLEPAILIASSHARPFAPRVQGNCKYARGDYAAARELYERALTAHDDCFEARYNLGQPARPPSPP